MAQKPLFGGVTFNLPDYTGWQVAFGSELAPGSGAGSDSAPAFSQICRGLVATVTGHASVNFVDGSSDSVPLVAGVELWALVTGVVATNTTATGIHGLH